MRKSLDIQLGPVPSKVRRLHKAADAAYDALIEAIRWRGGVGEASPAERERARKAYLSLGNLLHELSKYDCPRRLWEGASRGLDLFDITMDLAVLLSDIRDLYFEDAEIEELEWLDQGTLPPLL